MKKVIIVGASHGGHQMAIDLADMYDDININVYEQSDFVSFMSCGMQLFLENKVTSQKDVRNFNPDTLVSSKIHVFNNSLVTSIDPKNKTITVKNQKNDKTFIDNYDKLVLSSGVVPKTIVKNGKYNNVFLMRGYNWATKIKSILTNKNIKNISIIGSGYIGIEAMEVFVKNNKNVTLFDVHEYPLQNYLNKDLCDIITNEIKTKNVNLVMNKKITSLHSNDGKNIDYISTDNKNYNTDLVLCALGVKPNTKWLENTLSLDSYGFINTNAYLRTNYKDIYAIGDAIKPFSIPANKPIPIALATTVREEANYVTHHIFENIPSESFHGVVGSSALSIFDYKFATIGLNESTAKKVNVPVFSSFYKGYKRPSYVKSNNPIIYICLTVSPYDHRILGGSILSKNDVTSLGNILSLVIEKRMTLEDVLNIDFFFQPNFNRQLNALTLAARKALGYSDFY